MKFLTLPQFRLNSARRTICPNLSVNVERNPFSARERVSGRFYKRNNLLSKLILSINDLTRAVLEPLFARADEIAQTAQPSAHPVASRPPGQLDPAIEQALGALYMIHCAKGTLDGLRIALLGNLKFSAQAQALARLLGLYEVRLSFVSPAALSMPYDLSDDLRAAGLEVEETNDLATTLLKTDVLYLSRIDSARVESKVYAKTQDFYKLSPALLNEAKPGLFILGEWDGATELLAESRQREATALPALQLALNE